jgi:hypothetical protein
VPRHGRIQPSGDVRLFLPLVYPYFTPTLLVLYLYFPTLAAADHLPTDRALGDPHTVLRLR